MEVKLIRSTDEPISVMWVAARTCYSEKSPIEMWDNGGQTDKDKKWKLVKTVLDSGHQSIAEHINFTFAISGISRACSHQLVRHRAGVVFSQQSQRYVEIKEDAQEILQLIFQFKDAARDNDIEKGLQLQNKLTDIANNYFVDVDKEDIITYCTYLINYLTKIEDGKKAEDARMLLPNATKTNIVMTMNFRELIHVCNLRLCTRAQKEIRQLFTLIKKEVEKIQPELATLLVPSCEVAGFCMEHKCCGRKPSISEMRKVYYSCKDDFISKEDFERILSDGEPNVKLKELMQMKSVLE